MAYGFTDHSGEAWQQIIQVTTDQELPLSKIPEVVHRPYPFLRRLMLGVDLLGIMDLLVSPA